MRPRALPVEDNNSMHTHTNTIYREKTYFLLYVYFVFIVVPRVAAAVGVPQDLTANACVCVRRTAAAQKRQSRTAPATNRRQTQRPRPERRRSILHR